MTNFISHIAFLGYLLSSSTCGNGTVYFPPGIFAEDAAYDQTGAEGAAEYLAVFGEPPLFPAPENREVYRFLWLRGFDPAIIVKIGRSQGGVVIKTGVLPGTSPEERPEIRQYDGTDQDWRSLQNALSNVGFWQSLNTKPTPAGEIVIDGSQWIIEGIRDGNYKAVQRIFPREDDEMFVQLGLEFLRIGSIDVEADDVY